jgi:hypothetical protein
MLGTKRRMVRGLNKLIVEKNLTNVRMRMFDFIVSKGHGYPLVDFKTQKKLFHDGDSYSYAMTALDTPQSQHLHGHVSGSPSMV